MDIAIVTGAERGIGLQIARKLIDLGFRVYGFAQDFNQCPFEHPDFVQVTCDLTARAELESAWEQINGRDPMVSVLVNAAQHRAEDSFEASPLDSLEYTVQTELLCPLVLTRLALPSLIRYHGYVINIAWNGTGHGPSGAINAATQGGLHFFARKLYDEVRDTGVKVSTLYPEYNPGEPDPQSRLVMEPQSSIEAPLFAQAVETVLRYKENNCLSEIVVRPQGTREEPKIPASVAPLVKASHSVQLPERKFFPVEPEPIPTPPRERPFDAPPPDEDDEWDDDDDDDELDRMLAESRNLINKRKEEVKRDLQRKRDRKQPRDGRREKDGDRQPQRQRQDGDQNRDQSRDQNQGEDGDGNKKRRRRRRRGGRNRRDRDGQGQRPPQDGAPREGNAQQGDRPPQRDQDTRPSDERPAKPTETAPARRDSKPRSDAEKPHPSPQKSATESVKSEKTAEPKPVATESAVSAETPKPKKKVAKKAAKKATKKAAKKAAKKATKKAAKKATKKAAKKAAKKAVKKVATEPGGD
ncbi:MAG: SDR family NAD(P)-dependent oxidoreductase [Verrucomicrobiota bacterium]